MPFLDNIALGPWDLALVLVVSVQTTLLACVATPRAKSIFLTLPVPFTVIALAVGLPMDAGNVLGLLLGFAYIHGVRLLHDGLRVPIVAAILLSLAAYTVVAWSVSDLVPSTSAVFWASCALVFTVGLLLLLCTRPRAERAHRTSLPVWQKLPAVIGVVLFLIVVKQELRGFATVFPLLTVVGAYEARHCLWTMSRAAPTMMLCLVPLIAVAYLALPALGLVGALGAGWLMFLALYVPLARWQWQRWPAPLS